MDFVDDFNHKCEGKHIYYYVLLIKQQITNVSYQGVHPDAMQSERFGCVTKIMFPKTFISSPVSILIQYFQIRIIWP